MLWSRKKLALANWCVLTDHSIDAVGDLLGLSPRCVKKGLFILSVNSFIMYPLGVRTPFRSFLLILTLSRPFGRFASRDFDRRGFNARPLEAAFENRVESRF